MGEIQKKNMTKTALMIMVSVVLSRILGFFRTMLIPEKLGGMSEVSDAYNLAFLLPDLMFSLLVGGAIAAALIPILSGYVENQKEKEGWKAVSTFLNVVIIAMVTVCAFGIIFAPQLMNVIASGYGHTRIETFDLSVKLTRILFPSVCFLMLAGLCNGILNSYHKFAVAAFGPSIYNFLCIMSILFLSVDNPDVNYGVKRVVLGVVISSFCYFLFQIVFTYKHLKFYRPKLYVRHPGFKKMLKLAIPSLLTTSVMQVNIIISNSVSTNFSKGSVTALNLANKTWQMPLGIIAQSMGVAMLPVLSALYAANKKEEYIQKFNKAIRSVLMLAVPASFAFMILANPIIRTLFKFSGKLTESNITLTANILVFYSIALIAQSVNTILNRSFFSSHDAVTPLISGMVAIGTNILLAILLYKHTAMGVKGIPLAYSLAACVNMIILASMLNKKLNIFKKIKEFSVEMVKVVMSSLVMVVIIFAVDRKLIPTVIGMQTYLNSKVVQIAVLAVESCLGVGIYFVIMLLLKSKDIKDLTDKYLKKA